MLAFDIGGTNTRYGVITDQKVITATNIVPTPRSHGDFLSLITDIISTHSRESYVIFGIPGTINTLTGAVDVAPNIALPSGFKLNEFLYTQFPKKHFAIYNDADLIAMGEFSETLPHSDAPFIVLTLGTGIGSGILINKKLFTGINGYGSEAGHSIVDFRQDAHICSCGNRGCAEAYFSARAFCEEHKLLTGIDSNNALEAITYLREYSPESLDRALDALAALIAGLINILHPSHVRYYGGLSPFVTESLDALIGKIQKRLFSDTITAIDFSLSQLHDTAYLYGALYSLSCR
jgi:glucokinase